MMMTSKLSEALVEYEFVGSMYMFEVANDTSRSLGTRIVEAVQPLEKDSS